MHSLFLVALTVDTLGHGNISRDPGVLQQSQDLPPSRSMAGMHGAEAQKMPLSWIEQCADLGESCLPTFAAGKVIFGCVRTTSATDLPMVFVYRGCQKGVDDISRVRPGHLHRHTRDLSALIDVASRDYVEVGTCGK